MIAVFFSILKKNYYLQIFLPFISQISSGNLHLFPWFSRLSTSFFLPLPSSSFFLDYLSNLASHQEDSRSQISKLPYRQSISEVNAIGDGSFRVCRSRFSLKFPKGKFEERRGRLLCSFIYFLWFYSWLFIFSFLYFSFIYLVFSIEN